MTLLAVVVVAATVMAAAWALHPSFEHLPQFPAARDDIVAQDHYPTEDHYLEGFDLRSVARFAVRFFTCVLAALILATFALWILASLLGLVGAFERFMRGIGFTDFGFLSIELLAGVCLIGAAFSIFMVVLTCVAAALYNVLAYRWEGVRIYVSGPRTAAPTTVSSDGESAPAPPPPRRRVLARGGRRVRS